MPNISMIEKVVQQVCATDYLVSFQPCMKGTLGAYFWFKKIIQTIYKLLLFQVVLWCGPKWKNELSILTFKMQLFHAHITTHLVLTFIMQLFHAHVTTHLILTFSLQLFHAHVTTHLVLTFIMQLFHALVTTHLVLTFSVQVFHALVTTHLVLTFSLQWFHAHVITPLVLSFSVQLFHALVTTYLVLSRCLEFVLEPVWISRRGAFAHPRAKAVNLALLWALEMEGEHVLISYQCWNTHDILSVRLRQCAGYLCRF